MPATSVKSKWSSGSLVFTDNSDNSVLTVGSTGITAHLGITTTKGTGTCSSDAVTINTTSGVITTESKTTAAGGTFTITLTNSKIAATSVVLVNANVVAGNGTPVVASIVPGSGSATIVVQNVHASAAFNAALKLMFLVL